ncbi:hypothetical protein SDC49_02045 [Lactobacillus sp. R2/2]|nr:hypothetical protein [Lactobacillus sp. R2/2]
MSVALFGGGLAHPQSVDAALSKKQAISIIKKKNKHQPVHKLIKYQQLNTENKNDHQNKVNF